MRFFVPSAQLKCTAKDQVQQMIYLYVSGSETNFDQYFGEWNAVTGFWEWKVYFPGEKPSGPDSASTAMQR